MEHRLYDGVIFRLFLCNGSSYYFHETEKERFGLEELVFMTRIEEGHGGVV